MILSDAVKGSCSFTGEALLQWDFTGHNGEPRRSSQMPEEVVDKILEWRDTEKRACASDSGHTREKCNGREMIHTKSMAEDIAYAVNNARNLNPEFYRGRSAENTAQEAVEAVKLLYLGNNSHIEYLLQKIDGMLTATH